MMSDKALSLELIRARAALKKAGYIYDKEKGWIFLDTRAKVIQEARSHARKRHKKLPSKQDIALTIQEIESLTPKAYKKLPSKQEVGYVFQETDSHARKAHRKLPSRKTPFKKG